MDELGGSNREQHNDISCNNNNNNDNNNDNINNNNKNFHYHSQFCIRILLPLPSLLASSQPQHRRPHRVRRPRRRHCRIIIVL